MTSSHDGHIAHRTRPARARTFSPTSSDEVLDHQVHINTAELHFWEVVDRLALVCTQRPQEIRGRAYDRNIRLCSSEGDECQPASLPDRQCAQIRAQDVRALEEQLLRSRALHNLIWHFRSEDRNGADASRELYVELFWFRSLRFVIQSPVAEVSEISTADIAAILRRCHQELADGHFMRPCSGRVRWLLRGDDTEVWPERILQWRLEPLAEEILRAAVDARRRVDEDEVWDRYRHLYSTSQTRSPPRPGGPRRSPRVLRNRGRGGAQAGGREGFDEQGEGSRLPFQRPAAGGGGVCDSSYSWEPSDRSTHSRDASEVRDCQAQAVIQTPVRQVVIRAPVRRVASQRVVVESAELSQSYEGDGEWGGEVSPLSEDEEGGASPHHSQVSPLSDSD